MRLINLSFEQLTYHQLTTKLQELSREDVGDPTIPLELQKKAGPQTPSAALSSTEKEGFSSKGKKMVKGKFTCYWCQKKGHMAQDCSSRKAGKPKVPRANQAANMAQEKWEVENSLAFSVVKCQPDVINIAQEDKDVKVICKPLVVDSGASHHYTNDREHIHKNYETSTGAVSTAGSEVLEVAGKGMNKPFGIVKLVPKIDRSLLSVGQLTDDPEIDINFNGSRCTIKKQDIVIATATKGEDNLYRIKNPHFEKLLSVNENGSPDRKEVDDHSEEKLHRTRR